ncbi:MAG: MerR family transcriptional regulator [Acidimicrobiia bacterium]
MCLVSIGEFARRSRLSPKALRLYEELGRLPPARVDPDSGYRFYAPGQLDQARLVASLRQIGVPLVQIRVILGLDPGDAAAYIRAYWTAAEDEHSARRELADYLMNSSNETRTVMYEVATERSRRVVCSACCDMWTAKREHSRSGRISSTDSGTRRCRGWTASPEPRS